MTSSSFSVSPYRAIYTHFRPDFMISANENVPNQLSELQISGKLFLNLGEAEKLVPRDIMSCEPRHWMVFGQLVIPVQCCAEAPAAAAAPQDDMKIWL